MQEKIYRITQAERGDDVNCLYMHYHWMYYLVPSVYIDRFVINIEVYYNYNEVEPEFTFI